MTSLGSIKNKEELRELVEKYDQLSKEVQMKNDLISRLLDDSKSNEDTVNQSREL